MMSQNLTSKVKLKIPFLSSAMDTVTESNMAIAIGAAGGMGVIHRNLNINKQCKEVSKVKKKNLLVGAAVGTSNDDINRVKSLLDSGVDLIVIDTAHAAHVLGADGRTEHFKQRSVARFTLENR